MRFIALAAGLSYFFLGCVPSLAHASGAEKTSADVGVFVGNYGETFEYLRPWEPQAFMKGPVEVVRLSRPGKLKADFSPERFTPDQLLQILVIPRNAPGGAGSLAELREARRWDLEKDGADFDIDTAGDYWPRDSFRVRVKRPYELLQVYSATDRFFYIMSSGVGEDIAALRLRVGGSLSNHLLDTTTRATPERGDVLLDGLPLSRSYAALFAYFYLPYWRWINGACLLLLGLSALLRLPRVVKSIAIGALIGGNLWGLAASGMAALIFAASGMQRMNHGMFSIFYLAPAMPWIFRRLAARLRAQKEERLFRAAGALSIALVVFAIWMHLGEELASGAATFQLVPVFAFPVGVLYGALFGALYRWGDR